MHPRPRAAPAPRPRAARVTRAGVAVALLAAAPPAPAPAGAIRPSAQMGPRARRMLANIRRAREAREESRALAKLARRAAVVRVRGRGDSPDTETKVARAFEGALTERGFRVRPFRRTRARLAEFGDEVFRSPLTLRQLARRMKVGRLLLLEIRELRVADGRHAGFAAPSWWGDAERAQEFAEAHLRLRLYDALTGEFVLDRQDRQHLAVPRPAGGPARTAALEAALLTCVDHLLTGVVPHPVSDPAAAGETAAAAVPPGEPPARRGAADAPRPASSRAGGSL